MKMHCTTHHQTHTQVVLMEYVLSLVGYTGRGPGWSIPKEQIANQWKGWTLAGEAFIHRFVKVHSSRHTVYYIA